MKSYITALTIAGSDPSGGAGIQADIKTMSALGVYAMSAITAIAVENTVGVRAVAGIDPEIVASQVDAVFDDIRPDAVKIGMLFSAETVNLVADRLSAHCASNIVLDPVMIATSGDKLITDDAIDMIVKRIIPIATLITPNVNEAKALTGTSDISLQIASLRSIGAKNILLKGGDRDCSDDMAVDYLVLDGCDTPILFESKRVDTKNTHGTGCTLSSAITSFLARGYNLTDSVSKAKLYVTEALRAGAEVTTGTGHGPVNHLFNPQPSIIINK